MDRAGAIQEWDAAGESMNAKLSQVEIDRSLELAIDRAYEEMLVATDEDIKRDHFRVMTALIGLRSEDQIKRMQRERRLAIREAKG